MHSSISLELMLQHHLLLRRLEIVDLVGVLQMHLRVSEEIKNFLRSFSVKFHYSTIIPVTETAKTVGHFDFTLLTANFTTCGHEECGRFLNFA